MGSQRERERPSVRFARQKPVGLTREPSECQRSANVLNTIQSFLGNPHLGVPNTAHLPHYRVYFPQGSKPTPLCTHTNQSDFTHHPRFNVQHNPPDEVTVVPHPKSSHSPFPIMQSQNVVYRNPILFWMPLLHSCCLTLSLLPLNLMIVFSC